MQKLNDDEILDRLRRADDALGVEEAESEHGKTVMKTARQVMFGLVHAAEEVLKKN